MQGSALVLIDAATKGAAAACHTGVAVDSQHEPRHECCTGAQAAGAEPCAEVCDQGGTAGSSTWQQLACGGALHVRSAAVINCWQSRDSLCGGYFERGSGQHVHSRRLLEVCQLC